MARANIYWQEQSPWPIHEVMSWSPEQDSLFSLVTSHLKRTQPRYRHNTIVWPQSQIYLSILDYSFLSTYLPFRLSQSLSIHMYTPTLTHTYVGRTTQRLDARINQHIRSYICNNTLTQSIVPGNQSTPSAITHYL